MLAPLALVLTLSGCQKNDAAPVEGTSSSAGSAAQRAPKPPDVPVPAAALKGFEGELGLLMKSSGEHKPVPPLTLRVKGTKVRLDLPEGLAGASHFGRVHVVLSAADKKLFAVLEDKKQVVTLNLDKISDELKSFSPAQPAGKAERSAPPKLTKTGQSDTVAGYRCEDWEITQSKGEKSRVCVSNEEASWFAMPSIGLPPEHAWARELLDGHHIPLRAISYDTSGAESSRVEVTRLERKPLAEALFELPAAYKVLDMGSMLRGMMAGGLPPGMLMPGHPPPLPGAGSDAQRSADAERSAKVQEMLRMMQERAKAGRAKTP